MKFRLPPIMSVAMLMIFAVVPTFAEIIQPSRYNGYEYPCLSATDNGIVWKYSPVLTYDPVKTNRWIVGGAADYYTWDRAVPTSTSGQITVPRTLNGKTIKEVAPLAFYGCNKLTRITIPSSINKFGNMALPTNDGKLKVVVFEGNEPTWLYSGNSGSTTPFSQNTEATIYVKPTATGWNVDIPGTYMGLKIDYLRSVDFNANGGSVSASTRWLVPGDAVGTLPTPSTRNGYTFAGWYTAKSGGTKISASTTVSANTTYYAQWTMNQYTVTFDANGGTGGKNRNIGAKP